MDEKTKHKMYVKCNKIIMKIVKILIRPIEITAITISAFYLACAFTLIYKFKECKLIKRNYMDEKTKQKMYAFMSGRTVKINGEEAREIRIYMESEYERGQKVLAIIVKSVIFLAVFCVTCLAYYLTKH